MGFEGKSILKRKDVKKAIEGISNYKNTLRETFQKQLQQPEDY